MKVSIGRSKNSTHLYISKSYRKDGKSTTKTVKKLGEIKELMPEHGTTEEEVIEWAKSVAKQMTKEEKEENQKLTISLSEKEQLKKGVALRFNCGYLYLKEIYHMLKLDDICKEIKSNTKAKYNLSKILETLVYSRILEPSSKRSSLETAKTFIKPPKIELQHIYRSLDVLSEHSDYIQAELYKNSKAVVKRQDKVLFYDCTNFFFEIEEEKGIRKYGKSKENRPNPIVQMGLMMDASGIPLAFTIFDGNKNEQPSLKPLEEQILRDFNLSEFVVCTDAGLASTANRRFNNVQNRAFIVTQSIKKLKEHQKSWALDPSGWRVSGYNELFNLNDVSEEMLANHTFYKEQWIPPELKKNSKLDFEQRIIVTYSQKYRDYQRAVRNRQIERAEKIIENGTTKITRNANSPSRFVTNTKITADGEIAEESILTLDDEKIANEEMYDGFYAVCTNLEDDVKQIVAVNHRRWQIEAAFRTMKTEFKSRPVYLQKDNRIEAHFLTCYIAFLIFRLLEIRLDEAFTTTQIIKTLRNMELHKLEGYGYLASYMRTDLTDALNEISKFSTDHQFISNTTMRKILRKVKNG